MLKQSLISVFTYQEPINFSKRLQYSVLRRNEEICTHCQCVNFRKQSDKYVKIGNAYKLNSMYLGTSLTEMKPLRTYIKEYLLKLCLQQQKN